MSFLQPVLLLGLPLALLPVIIHLINRHRHRTVQWAAMMFLLDARKMNKGLAKLRQILILTMRVAAVAMLVLAASRPLSGGWLALTGGKADTIILLLDRSASMEEQTLETGESKRSTTLTKLTDLIENTATGSEIVLIDSATLTPTVISKAAALSDLPQTAPTDTAADIPALLQAAADFLITNESGRTDIWLASDQRQPDWQPASGQWQSIRADLTSSESVRLFLLNFPEIQPDNLSISATNVKRQRSSEGLQLVMDLSIRRGDRSEKLEDLTVPVEFTINGTRTVQDMTITGSELIRLGHVIPLGKNDGRGWGRLDLPADDNPLDNTAYFVFDEPATRKTVILSDDSATAEAISSAANAPIDHAVYETVTLSTDLAAQIPWEETALLFWHAQIPQPDSAEGALLKQHVASGRTLVFLPPPIIFPQTEAKTPQLFGFQWKEWTEANRDSLDINWWRTDSGLLSNTQNGNPLPLDQLKLFKSCLFTTEGQDLLKLKSEEPVITRILTDQLPSSAGALYAWGTLPRTDHSTLATDGVAFFVMTHRALDAGTNAVSKAKHRETGPEALPSRTAGVSTLSTTSATSFLSPSLRSGAYEISTNPETSYLIALNRPVSEDILSTVSPQAIDSLLEGVEFRQINDKLGNGDSLASEVWRIFLTLMALALIVEAALCIPPRTEVQKPSIRLSSPNSVK